VTKAIKWADEPGKDDFAKAAKSLRLLGVTQVSMKTPDAAAEPVMAKDLLRFARLPGLPQNNAGVTKWTKRIKAGEKVPPCLLVRGSLTFDRPLIIAEGYHRVSACYLLDEQTEVAVLWLAVS
jgi:hypothetical protein